MEYLAITQGRKSSFLSDGGCFVYNPIDAPSLAEKAQLQSISQALLGPLGRLLGRKLIYLCNNSGDELMKFVEWHRGHYKETWEKLKILSAERGSYL